MSAARGRYRRESPCPACSGWPTLPPGKGVRCFGFAPPGSPFFYCTREEYSAGASFHAGANAYQHLLAGECRCGQRHSEQPPEPRPHTDPAEPEPLDPSTLDAVYRHYLELCPLRPAHRDYWASRGAADLAAALRHGYGSLPLGRGAARTVTRTLIAEFGETCIERVPGFYLVRSGGELTTHTALGGYDASAIPARDGAGRITGLVRRTISDPENRHGKYETFKRGGAAFATLAGPAPAPDAARVLVITEGIHKAHVAAQLGNALTLGLPGAHLNAAHLELIRTLRPDTVIEALDADKFSNAAIGRQRRHMQRALSEVCADVRTAVWEVEDGKGLDDLLAAGSAPRLRGAPPRPALTPRQPYAIAEPGPVPAGRPLAEVQRETERLIDDFVRHRVRHKGEFLLMAPPPGTGKTTAAQRAIAAARAVARVVVGTHAKADEIAAAYPGVTAVVGRNAETCQNFPVVEAARRKRHDVATLVCQQCPFLLACRSTPGAYYQQFERSGTLVGPSELLFSGAFLRHGELVVIDDADLPRTLVERRTISAHDALALAGVVEPGPLRELLTVVQRAVDATAAAADGFAPPLVGPAAWDALARAAGGTGQLQALLASVPRVADLLPGRTDGAPLTVEDIEAAPPADLVVLISTLREEVTVFATGAEFNSAASVHPGGLELRRLREPLRDRDSGAPLRDRDSGAPLLAQRAVLALDATPLEPLYDQLARGLRRLPDYRPVVAMPPRVRVTQIADHFHGKTSLERTKEGSDGQMRRPGQEALLASLQGARRDFPGDREAVLCAKGLRAAVVEAGVPEERVLTFYGNRGLNSVEDTDVLHVLGRPQAPDHEALQLAHALHRHDPQPIRPHLQLRPEAYAGYRAADGGGRAIDVLDFVDPRAAAVFRQFREAELLQGVHRARLYRVADAQGDLLAPEAVHIARAAGERRTLRVVIHSAQPVPGLPVHDLLHTPATATPNHASAAAAAGRAAAAQEELTAAGMPVGVRALARAAGCRPATAAKVVRGESGLIRPFPPVRKIPSSNGWKRADQVHAPPEPVAEQSVAPPISAGAASARGDPPTACPRCRRALDVLTCWPCGQRLCELCWAPAGGPALPRCRACRASEHPARPTYVTRYDPCKEERDDTASHHRTQPPQRGAQHRAALAGREGDRGP